MFRNPFIFLLVYNDKIQLFLYAKAHMKRHLIFVILFLSSFSSNSEEVKVICSPYKSDCINCPEFKTLFPLEEFSGDLESLDIDADNSEISGADSYYFSGCLQRLLRESKETMIVHIFPMNINYLPSS